MCVLASERCLQLKRRSRRDGRECQIRHSLTEKREGKNRRASPDTVEGVAPPWRERFLSAALRLGGRLGCDVCSG